MTENQEIALENLSRIKKISNSINSKMLEIEALRYEAQGIGAIRYDKERVQTTPENYMEIALVDANEKELEIAEDLEKLDKLKQDAYHIVRKMENEDERTLIINHYLNDIPVNKLISVMNMSERKIYYLREDALESYGYFLGGTE